MTAVLRLPQYEGEFRDSMERRMAQPKGLGQLLAWFLGEWGDEVPTTLHRSGVWHDHVGLTEDRRSVGGSLIGSPALAAGFRAYLENSASEVDADGTLKRPMHRALAAMAGRSSSGTHSTPNSFMARFLFAAARAAGDLEAAGASMGIPPEVVPVYAEASLFRLWRAWSPRAQ